MPRRKVATLKKQTPTSGAGKRALFDDAKRLRALVAELQALLLAIVEADAKPALRAARKTRQNDSPSRPAPPLAEAPIRAAS